MTSREIAVQAVLREYLQSGDGGIFLGDDAVQPLILKHTPKVRYTPLLYYRCGLLVYW